MIIPYRKRGHSLSGRNVLPPPRHEIASLNRMRTVHLNSPFPSPLIAVSLSTTPILHFTLQ
ncbi:hypothetical protein BJV78DRAFT_1237537 [Lactifluus subvellereus]|nr:hypothetical protein BJV78DRAFT_1237537 [Lactifluus subvellereus]